MHDATLLSIKTEELEVVTPLKNRIMKRDECELLVQIGILFGTGETDNPGSFKFITGSGK